MTLLAEWSVVFLVSLTTAVTSLTISQGGTVIDQGSNNPQCTVCQCPAANDDKLLTLMSNSLTNLQDAFNKLQDRFNSMQDGLNKVQENVFGIQENMGELRTDQAKLMEKFGPKNTGKDCAELYKNGVKLSGVYTIYPSDEKGTIEVYCDMTTDGGGWTLFQRRQDGSVDFYRGWQDYKLGFGNLNGEFWLGNDYINRLTNQDSYQLRVDMEDTSGTEVYAAYDKFSITSEKTSYTLSLGAYSGNAGDSLTSRGKGSAFSSKDRDNDASKTNCAQTFKGAWWYKDCHYSNLNGLYHHGAHTSFADGVNWYSFKGHNYSLKRTEMKMRPAGFISSI